MIKLADFLLLTTIHQIVFSLPLDVEEPTASPVLPPVEWFGDSRGGNPDDQAFYDVSYDDLVCPNGLRSSALRNYAYVGKVIRTMKPTNGTDDCLRQCFQIAECRSINAYSSKTKRSHCELNADDQFDDPTKLITVTESIYFDRIQCPVDIRGMD